MISQPPLAEMRPQPSWLRMENGAYLRCDTIIGIAPRHLHAGPYTNEWCIAVVNTNGSEAVLEVLRRVPGQQYDADWEIAHGEERVLYWLARIVGTEPDIR